MRLSSAGLVLLLGGCAAVSAISTNDREKALMDAGFTQRTPSTPQQLQAFGTLPARRLMRIVSSQGVAYYYADPNGCHCLYYGTPAAYQALRSTGAGVAGTIPADQFEPTDVNGVNPAELTF